MTGKGGNTRFMYLDMLSVIIPAYNAENYLPYAVQSALQESWNGPREILLINDGSTDQTVPIAQGLNCRIFSKERGGAASARNLGIENARGSWILLLDADDVLVQGALSALYAPFSENPEIDAVFGYAEDFISPELTNEQRQSLHIRPAPYEGVLPGCSLIKKKVFDQIGLFNTSLSAGETLDWMIRLRSSGNMIVQIKDVVLQRRLHLTNTGRIDRKKEFANYASILRKRLSKQ